MPRKTPILLRRGPMSGAVVAVHRYTRTSVNGRDIVKAALDGKQDVTADFDALCLDELFGEDAPDIVGVLDGAADGETLAEDERRQVRAFRERLRAMAERHNARQEEAKDAA